MRLTATGLAGERGGEAVFSNVSFVLESGLALVVTGPNGSGKSTLLRIVGGLLPSAGGALVFEGDPEQRTLGQACHYLGHQNAMKATLTVEENLTFWRDFAGEPHYGIDHALDEVGLAGLGHLPFGTLSTGQRRRAAIARLLISRRPVWLLDEPTAGLDRASETRFAALMADHLARGGLIIAATHSPLGLEGANELRMERTVHG